MSKHFNIQQTEFDGVAVLQRKQLRDSRGYFERLFCQQELQSILKGKQIKQINHTLTEKKGTVRGMHFQYPPHAETKFISCINGKVFDVAVDLRKESITFMGYYAEILTPENSKTLMIPEGFAHGFQTLTNDCEMLYFHTEAYHVESEGCLNAMDPVLNIKWPNGIQERSKKDRNHVMIDGTFEGITL